MQGAHNNQEQIRSNRQRIRDKVKGLNLSSKMKLQRDQQQGDVSDSNRKSKFRFCAKDFESFFTLSDKIGQGAHGIVRKCVEKSTGDVYCVKITQGDQQYVRISQKTYSLLYLIDSSYTIKPKNLFINEQTDTIYLVMEYIAYPNLNRFIQMGTSTPAQIHNIVKAILQAVCDLHRAGVCHRDLKPDNILYDPETGTLKLIDFGISKLIYNKKKEMKEKMWTVTGTIQYKAPQMFQGKEYDQLVDSWAIGVITYQLVYGKLPFQSEFVAELIQQILDMEPQFPECEHPEAILAVDFMKSLLRKDSRRSTCLQALHHPWISQIEQGNRTRVSSEDFINQQMMFRRYRQMSVGKFNGTLSPVATANPSVGIEVFEGLVLRSGDEHC